MRRSPILAGIALAMLGWATPAMAQSYRISVVGTPAIATGATVATTNVGATVTMTLDVIVSGLPGTLGRAVHMPSVRITGPDGMVTATSSNSFPFQLNPPFGNNSFQIPFSDIGDGYFLEMDVAALGSVPSSLDAAVGTYQACSIFCSNFLILQGGPSPSYLLLDCQTVTIEAFDFDLSCTPANNSVSGTPVTLIDSSLGLGNGSGLHLEASGGPPGEFGFVITSNTGSAPTPIAQGILCLGWPWDRYTGNVAQQHGLPQLDSHGRFDASGRLQNQVVTSSVGSGFDVPLELPLTPSGQTIVPGDTCFFQVCYRDRDAAGNPTINFSDRLEITFP